MEVVSSVFFGVSLGGEFPINYPCPISCLPNEQENLYEGKVLFSTKSLLVEWRVWSSVNFYSEFGFSFNHGLL